MKIETKYSLGQPVWLIIDNKIREGSVNGITIDVTVAGSEIKYRARANMRDPLQMCYESELFASKADLINSL